MYVHKDLNLCVEKASAGEFGYGAGEHAFARNAAQRYIRAQKTRSKCRRRFTALHHHTRTPRLRFLTHNSKFRLVKLKTLSTGVRIFNGAVRTEREFPLKILFLACAQGFIVLIITRNGAEISRSRSPNTISVSSVSKCFRISPAPCRR